MGFNKIPLALKFDDVTGNANGLVEFRISDAQDISGIPVSSLSGINLSSVPSDGQGLVFTNGVLSNAAVGGGGSTTVNLGIAATSTQVEITNSAGDNAVITAADSSDAGLFLPAEKTKLGAVEANADVTDATNVAAAGALMDSELASIADVKALDQSVVAGASPNFATTNMTDASNKRFMTDAQESKLDSVETNADVTDATNVAAAGALMDSELASIADVKALDQSVIAGASPNFATTNMSDASNKRFMTDAQESKLDSVETNADVTDATNVTNAGALMDSELTSIADVKALDQSVVAGASPNFVTTNMTDASDKRFMSDAQESKLDSVESNADVTDTTNVTNAGALMDSEVTNLAFVKGLTGGISDGNVLTANNAVADDDFLRVNGTEVEGLTAAETQIALSVLPSSIASNGQIYYNNGGIPAGLGSTTASRHFISLAGYDTSKLEEGAQLVWSGTGDAANWVITTEGGKGAFGTKISAPAGTNGGAGSVAANSLILVSGTSVSSTTSFQLDTRSQSFLSTPSGTTLGLPQVLHRQVGAPVASSNSTSLAELVSYTLPANHLALGDIDIRIRGRQLAQGSNLRWNFKIGGTNVLNSSISQGTYSDMTTYDMHIQISKTATDKQLVTASFRQATGSGSAAGRGSWAGIHRDGIITNDSVTADESTALALSLEAQQSDAAQTVTVDNFRVTLMPDPV